MNALVSAFFQDNASLVNWVNAQPLSTPLTCLGDGHDGIWNIYAAIGTPTQRREFLDWYHLVENLGKVGGSQQRLDAAEACLWQGDVDGAIAQFNDWHARASHNLHYLSQPPPTPDRELWLLPSRRDFNWFWGN